jgi:hypothetical protein
MLKKITAFLGILALFAQPLSVAAQTDSRGFTIDPAFDPNAVLMDEDVFSSSGMTHDRLVAFLDAKGKLADTRVKDLDGTEKSAADVIWEISGMYQINPKYIVALLQKEQSLVEDATPSQGQLDWATGYGVCDSCSKDDPSISDFKGFANQIYYAARQMREKYLMSVLATGRTISGVGPGITTVIDGIAVTPANAATAALYSYTPHIHGNLNLWNIWRRWFSKNYPDGTVVRGTPSDNVYWIRFGVKRKFASLAVASSLVDLSKAAVTSDTELSAYPDGDPIAFPNYALLLDPHGAIWLIVGNERRHIADMETFKKFGFNMDEVDDATDADLAPYTIGEPITTESMYPQGRLVKVQGEKSIWYAESGKKSLVSHPALLTLYFPGERPQTVSKATLDELETTDPYAIHDGELVRTPDAPAVFAIEAGKKRPIPSATVFEGMGWNWSSVEFVPSSLLDGYSEGDPILIDTGPTAIVSSPSTSTISMASSNS